MAAELRKLEQDVSSNLTNLTAKLASESIPEQLPTSRQTVSKEIEDLRRKLETRKIVRDVPDSVEAARSEVVRCLRENDRRPLDCWREVEAFKEQVRRLEKGWVERVIS